MKKIALAIAGCLLFCSHDMFLKLDDFHLPANTEASIHLYNGTFERSDNVIDRNRMLDVSLVGNGVRQQVDSTAWSEKDSITILNFTTGAEGTWVAGVSTRPRNIEMSAEDFNGYLAHDGVLGMLKWREDNNALDQDAVEKYSKHVKTIFQVGKKKTEDWVTVLGYPIEFIPAVNPYDLHAGDTFEALLLWQGESLANQLVYADFTPLEVKHSHDHNEHDHDHGDENDHDHDHGDAHQHDHDHDEAHTHEDGHEHEDEEHAHSHATTVSLRTNDEGIVSLPLTEAGNWYLRTIHLVTTEEEGLTHESNWATLTFGVAAGGHGHDHDHNHDHGHDHNHDHDHGEHDHDHDHEADTPFGIPSYLYWVGSALLVGLLYFWFNRKR